MKQKSSVILWAARDKHSNDLFLSTFRPVRSEFCVYKEDSSWYFPIADGNTEVALFKESKLFPEVTYENSPVQVELKLTIGMKLITRESEIKTAALEACLNDGLQPKTNRRVDWFMKGARWADEHPEGKWRDASEPPKTHIDVLVSDGVDYAIGHYNHDFGEWCISSRDVRNVERWMPLPYIPWIE